MPRYLVPLALFVSLLVNVRAWAVFEAEMPLAQLVKDSHVIAVVRPERINRERGTAVLKVEKIVSGNEALSEIRVKLIAAPDGEGNPQDMLVRMDDDLKLIIFLSHIAPNEHQIFAYSYGGWFKLRGTGEGDAIVGQFIQGEPYLRKTYHGEVEQLAQLIADKAELPPIDKQAKPGLGPIVFGAAQPTPIEETTNEIQLGPAWTTDDKPQEKSAGPASGYIVAAVLAIAALGLVVMLTRSTREGDK